jgi:glycosyltransferase involved in cell wall biosynthesis
MKISATIITLNEESNIKAACESVAWADETVVVDSGSIDTTRKIAEACGARVITNPWPGFGAQKQFAVDEAKHEWIFSLDADERVSDELKKSIGSLRDKTDLADGYQIARRTYYQGRWIRGGGWYPDRQLRLFKKSKGHWKQRHVHESVTMDPGARVERLPGDLLQ